MKENYCTETKTDGCCASGSTSGHAKTDRCSENISGHCCETAGGAVDSAKAEGCSSKGVSKCCGSGDDTVDKAAKVQSEKRPGRVFFKWSWIFMILFFVLAVFDYRFALLGFICMLSPIFFAVTTKSKVSCNSYCPRGSLLSKFLQAINMGNSMPKFMLTKWFRISVVIIIFGVFGLSMYMSGGDLTKIGLAIFRMVLVTTVIALILGFVYKARSWCAICPMGYLSGEIVKGYKKKEENLKEALNKS